IGILAAIAIPVFLNQRQKGVDAGTKSDIKQAANEMESAFTDTQVYSLAGITIKHTAGSVVEGQVVSIAATGANDAYCLRAYNVKGSANGPTGNGYYFYDSANGGLKNVAPSTTTPGGTGSACALATGTWTTLP
ncbi:MAG: type IV pilin protein, partial [Mycobacteriales bacterium]